MVTYTVHFTECSCLGRTSSGAWDSQNTEFLLLTWPVREKWASSLNHTFWRKSGSCFWTTGTSQLVLSCHSVWEFVWSGFCMGTTEGHSSRFCEEMNKKDPTFESFSGVTFFGLQPTESLTASTFSGDLEVNFLPLVHFCPFLVDFINFPVSLNFFTKRVIWQLCGKLTIPRLIT